MDSNKPAAYKMCGLQLETNTIPMEIDLNQLKI